MLMLHYHCHSRLVHRNTETASKGIFLVGLTIISSDNMGSAIKETDIVLGWRFTTYWSFALVLLFGNQFNILALLFVFELYIYISYNVIMFLTPTIVGKLLIYVYMY